MNTTPDPNDPPFGPDLGPAPGPFRERLWRIIFLSDTPPGRAFDVVLLWIIAASVLAVMLESVDSIREEHTTLFLAAEWFFTIIFTIEYLTRLWVVRRPVRYARSFFGIVDLLSFLPTYLELLLAGSHYLMILRVLRLLRMFRVLKMAHHLGEAGVLMNALRASRAKISVFLLGILTLVCIEGTLMYLIEQDSNPGFRNIPQAIYWAIVTITTVGFGDVAPMTVLGKMMASVIMLTGFSILAVPTGVVTAELGREMARARNDRRRCADCGREGHDASALYCNRCGTRLP